MLVYSAGENLIICRTHNASKIRIFLLNSNIDVVYVYVLSSNTINVYSIITKHLLSEKHKQVDKDRNMDRA